MRLPSDAKKTRRPRHQALHPGLKSTKMHVCYWHICTIWGDLDPRGTRTVVVECKWTPALQTGRGGKETLNEDHLRARVGTPVLRRLRVYFGRIDGRTWRGAEPINRAVFEAEYRLTGEVLHELLEGNPPGQ